MWLSDHCLLCFMWFAISRKEVGMFCSHWQWRIRSCYTSMPNALQPLQVMSKPSACKPVLPVILKDAQLLGGNLHPLFLHIFSGISKVMVEICIPPNPSSLKISCEPYVPLRWWIGLWRSCTLSVMQRLSSFWKLMLRKLLVLKTSALSHVKTEVLPGSEDADMAWAARMFVQALRSDLSKSLWEAFRK